MMVTIGSRGSRSSSLSSSSCTASETEALTYSVWKPNSSATRLMVSASMRWLMLIIMPMLMQVAITLVTGTFIMLASSLAVTNSVNFRILLSRLSSLRRSSVAARTWSRFSRRYLALLAKLFLLVRRARVFFTSLATSSSDTCGFRAMSPFFCFLLPRC